MRKMRGFYEACHRAMGTKKAAYALRYLVVAHDSMQQLTASARVRLELRTVADLVDYLRWAIASCARTHNAGKDPGFDPTWAGSMLMPFVYLGGQPKSSLDYRARK